MPTRTLRTLQALRDFALVATAATLAAVSMATGIPAEQDGDLLDAELWQGTVTETPASLAQDGWYRLVRANGGVQVDAVSPRTAAAADDAQALYFRQPGTQLQTGWHAVPRTADVLRDAKPGMQVDVSDGPVRYSVRIESTAKGIAYEITQGGRTAKYVLGPFDAETSAIRFVADLDGDGLPDFLVDVGQEAPALAAARGARIGDAAASPRGGAPAPRATYLLLSTRAQSGASRPAAELWAGGF